MSDVLRLLVEGPTNRQIAERLVLSEHTVHPRGVVIYANLADQPARQAALDDDFLQFAERANIGAPKGPAEYPYEYLLVVARTPGG